MKEYIRPTMQGQAFVANEYVAACYLLACLRGPEGNLPDQWRWNASEKGSVSHSALGTQYTCADMYSNRIKTDDNGVITEISEFNKDQKGWLAGGLDDWIDKNANNICDAGDLIYWHTVSKNGDRRWNHWGYAKAADENHPNHS